jgi:hypothetical protein
MIGAMRYEQELAQDAVEEGCLATVVIGLIALLASLASGRRRRTRISAGADGSPNAD